jgi:hypothetical protein
MCKTDAQVCCRATRARPPVGQSRFYSFGSPASVSHDSGPSIGGATPNAASRAGAFLFQTTAPIMIISHKATISARTGSPSARTGSPSLAFSCGKSFSDIRFCLYLFFPDATRQVPVASHIVELIRPCRGLYACRVIWYKSAGWYLGMLLPIKDDANVGLTP